MRHLALLTLLVLSTADAKDPAREFPASWEGAWKGPCVVVRDGKAAMRFPMELHVAKQEGKPGWT